MADTMIMGATTCAVLYVDASIGGGAGAGATPATALANIPAVASLASNTVYLIRRDLTNAITLTSGTLTTGANIFLVGMPLTTDWLYGRAPAAAKTAWDADVPAYALAKFAGYQTAFSLSPIDRCGFHRLKFTRVSPGTGYGYAACASTMQLNAQASYSGSEYCTNGEYFFTNNWWCDDGITLSVPGWVTNTQYNSGGVQFQYARSVKFCNNHIEFSGGYNQNPPWNPTGAVCINYCRHLIANDNEFWFSSFGSTGNNFYGFSLYNSYYFQAYAEFSGNAINLVCQNYSYVSFFNPVYLNAKDIYSHDCTIKIDRYYSRPAITSGCYITNGYYCYGSWGASNARGKWDIQNITVDSGDISYMAGSLVNLAKAPDHYEGDSAAYPGSVVKNISAKCAPNSALVSSTNVSIANSYGGYAFYAYLDAEFQLVDTITAWHAMSGGMYVWYGAYEQQGQWRGPTLKNCSIKGTIYSLGINFLHISDWTLAAAPGTSKLYQYWTGTIYIETMAIDPGHVWAIQQWLYWPTGYGRCIIDTSDVPLYYYNTGGFRNDNMIAINNVGGIQGKWFGTNSYYQGQAWAAYRTGGADASIKLTSPGATDTHYAYLSFAPTPYRGLEWTPVLTGPATATIHFAHKFMTNPTYLMKRIKTQVLVPYWDSVVSEYQDKSVMGDIMGQLLDDSASTWNNESGLTQVKLVIPFTVTTAGQVVTLRIFYDWYDVNPDAYCYLDPLVEFAMV